MQTIVGPEKTALVVMSKYRGGVPILESGGGGGPLLLVVTLVLPPSVTLENVSDTGVPPVVGTTGVTTMSRPDGVFPAVPAGRASGASCTAMSSATVNMADGSNAGPSRIPTRSAIVNTADGSGIPASNTATFS